MSAGPAVRAARRSALRTGLAALASLALVACDRSGDGARFVATDVTGAEYGRTLALTDHTGTPRTLADWKGRLVVVFFGFTQCPDVCPTTLATMAEAMRKLGPDAERVQVLFVTLDPERDSQAVLAPYVTAFDPRFVGLRGDAEATAAAAREFKVFYQKVAGRTPQSYTLDHTAASYVLDGQGRLRLYVRHQQTADEIAADLRTLLSQAA